MPMLSRCRGEFLKQKCPVSTCALTSDRSKQSTADLILYKVSSSLVGAFSVITNPREPSFEALHLTPQDMVTRTDVARPPHQLWMLYMLECPLHTGAAPAGDKRSYYYNVLARLGAVPRGGQLDGHLPLGLDHRDPVREVGLLRARGARRATEHQLRRQQDQAGRLVRVQLRRQVRWAQYLLTTWRLSFQLSPRLEDK